MSIKITWVNGLDKSELGKVRKVYRTRYGYTGSGQHKFFLVWSDKYNKCVWVKDTDCEIV